VGGSISMRNDGGTLVELVIPVDADPNDVGSL
jgi:hypothetical protein